MLVFFLKHTAWFMEVLHDLLNCPVPFQIISLHDISKDNECYLAAPITSLSNNQQATQVCILPAATNIKIT